MEVCCCKKLLCQNKAFLLHVKIFSKFGLIKLAEMKTGKQVFEEIKKTNEIGQEYWSARELFTAVEYIKWDNFLNVIAKAKEACENSGQSVQDHFPRVGKMITLAKGPVRDIGDLHLSRYVCYLIIQNADPFQRNSGIRANLFCGTNT
jgi:hypothetical protein